MLIGTLDGVSSPARQDWPTLGVELRLGTVAERLRLDPSFEHAVVPVDHPVKVGPGADGAIVEPGWVGYLPAGAEELVVESARPGVAMLVGGTPFEARPRMFWNFVARTNDELEQAYRDWQGRNTERFAEVPSDLARIDSPRPPWLPSTDA